MVNNLKKNGFNQILKIDKERLQGYYERIKKRFNELEPIQIVTKFLVDQSIGTSIFEVSNILNYYKTKIVEKMDILDFAFEWIRANNLHFEYKKYLIKEQYKNYQTAIDDCIFRFFLNYDEHIRKILKVDIKEFEISTLYEIFFSSNKIKSLDLNTILEKHKIKVPTIFDENERINTKLFTLYSGLSEIIQNDYNESFPSEVKIIVKNQEKTNSINTATTGFNGTLLERIIKFCCFQKKKILKEEFEKAISQFLSSYLRFGIFYKFEEFKEILIQNLADYINSGLTEEIRKSNSLEYLQNQISDVMKEYEKKIRIKELDGLAWINDLKPVLKIFVVEYIDKLFD